MWDEDRCGWRWRSRRPWEDDHNANWMDVSDEDDKPGALAPYRLSMWWNVLTDFLLTFLILFAFGPFLLARMRKKWLDNAEIVREQRIVTLERILGGKPPPSPTTVPYR